MHKFFDYLAPDLPVKTIGELAGYIRRFAALFSGEKRRPVFSYLPVFRKSA